MADKSKSGLQKSRCCNKLVAVLKFQKGENIIEFYKKHGKVITNIAVVLLVAGAIYAKTQEQGSEALFRGDDLYLLAGAVLAFILLRMFTRKHEQDRDRR